MDPAYDPLHDPLDLPVQTLTVSCELATPVQFTPAVGNTPGTTLSGLFGNVVWDCGCWFRRQGLPACNLDSDRCRQPGLCPVHWLYKPYSHAHRRTLTRPVLLHAPELDSGRPVTAFTLRVTLWGRHAVAAAPLIVEVLQAMGSAGLYVQGQPIPFQPITVSAAPPQTLAERAAPLAAVAWRQAALVFITPCLYRETVATGAGQRDKLFLAGGELPLAGLLGNCAYELAAWDMEDRDLPGELDGAGRHQLARRTREAVRMLCEPVVLTHSALTPAALGTRLSKTNGRSFPLSGFLGQAELSGPLNPLLPWLLALALGGGGQKRAMGFGVMWLWLGP